MVNGLANPKGVKFDCEICGRAATLQCQLCRVTYYCTKEHQNVDWDGIHEKICQLLVPLRTPPLVIGSEEERMRRQASIQMHQRALIEMTRSESIKFLAHGKFELAIPGAIQALRISVDVYGAGAIELVPAYLLLAEANLGMQRYKQAEEYLSLANWSIVKNPNCSYAVRSQLQRNSGKLYAATGKDEDALKQLAHAVYYSSLMFGPEHVVTSGGFYQMACVFEKKKQTEAEAQAMFEKVQQIWNKHLRSLLIDTTSLANNSPPEPLNESQVTEGIEMLSKVLSFRLIKGEPPEVAEAHFTVGLAQEYLNDIERASDHYQKALDITESECGSEHPRTLELKRSIARCEAFNPSRNRIAASA